ncbi:MAG: hypothetical protein RSJ40_00250 [Acetivibrio sp.]
MLTAGAVTCITSIANKLDKLLSLEILLGVLIVFYIIGLITKAVISKVLDSGGIPTEEEEESKEDAESESEESEETVEEDESEIEN